MDIESRMKQTLQAIKDKPSSSSSELGVEVSILNELYNNGYIKAAVYSPLSGEQVFLNIRITAFGEQYLELLESPNLTETMSIQNWYNNPFLNMVLGIIAAVIVAGILRYLGWG